MFYSCVQAAINAQRTAVVNVELAKTSRPRRVDLFVECTHTHTLVVIFFYSYVCLTFFCFADTKLATLMLDSVIVRS